MKTNGRMKKTNPPNQRSSFTNLEKISQICVFVILGKLAFEDSAITPKPLWIFKNDLIVTQFSILREKHMFYIFSLHLHLHKKWGTIWKFDKNEIFSKERHNMSDLVDISLILIETIHILSYLVKYHAIKNPYKSTIIFILSIGYSCSIGLYSLVA